MDLKELKKLVAYARSAGISHFKDTNVEFSLSSFDPKTEKRVSKKIEAAEESARQKIADMDEEQLLLYSSSSFKDTEV